MSDKILIIDDDIDVCTVLKNNLEREGYEVNYTNNGLDGINKVKTEKIDLVILDLKLPDLHGTSVLEEIKALNDNIIVIILTGYPELETAIETLKNKAADYILKPFKIDNLRSIIQRELLNRNAQKQLGTSELTDIGKILKELREKKKMSLGTLAKKTELSKSFLSEVERKKKFPRLSTLQTIAKELEVDINLFFK